MIRLILLLIANLGLLAVAQADELQQRQQAWLEYTYQQVLVGHSQRTVTALQNLSASLKRYQADPSQQHWQVARDNFRDLALNWKKMEAVYVAGALDEDYLDHPRYIDYYHQGNESIPELVQRALDGEQPLRVALFKNSTKSLNALEYLLFGQQSEQASERRVAAALLAVQHLEPWLEEIADFYQDDRSFVEQGKPSMSKLVNRLIDSTYKLKNWRVGEAGGLVKKYQDKPSAKRLEYVHSGLSLDAIIAILETHQQLVNNEQDQDLMALGKAMQIGSEIGLIERKINEALQAARQMPRPLSAQVESDAYQQLFRQLTQLHNAYYFMLVDALGLDSQIIDADGD